MLNTGLFGGGNMTTKQERVAAAVGKNHDIVEKLDQLLTGPNDRAFVICDFEECKSNAKGRCTVYTVRDVPRMRTAPCSNYEARG